MLLMMLMTPMTNHLVASTCNQHRHPDSEKCGTRFLRFWTFLGKTLHRKSNEFGYFEHLQLRLLDISAIFPQFPGRNGCRPNVQMDASRFVRAPWAGVPARARRNVAQRCATRAGMGVPCANDSQIEREKIWLEYIWVCLKIGYIPNEIAKYGAHPCRFMYPL